jgi:hypothetical protein
MSNALFINSCMMITMHALKLKRSHDQIVQELICFKMLRLSCLRKEIYASNIRVFYTLNQRK